MSTPPPSPLPFAATASFTAAVASGHPRLYRDALTSVLSFLSLRELTSALSVSKEWSVAVHTMPPAMLTACLPIHMLHASPAFTTLRRRHVGELILPDGDRAEYDEEALLPLWLAEEFPLLHSLRMEAYVPSLLSSAEQVQLFPPRLQVVELFLKDSAHWKNAQLLLPSIGRLHELHTLRLRGESCRGITSLVALQQLPLLRNLELSGLAFQVMEQFGAEIRALHWLHRLHIDVGRMFLEQRAAIFIALLRDAPEEELCALQWRDFALNGVMFTDALTPLLLRLSSLECVEIHLADCTRMDFLSALPRLTALDLSLWCMKPDAWTNLLCGFTSAGLTRLRALKVYSGPGSSDDLMLLLSHTPSLTSLTLLSLAQLTSLSFFLQLPKLAETLTQLTMNCFESARFTAAHLPPLYVLQQLRELRLLYGPKLKGKPDRLIAADRAPFEQRPCAVLPHLEVFEWTAR
jgi:hypothetical protein